MNNQISHLNLTSNEDDSEVKIDATLSRIIEALNSISQSELLLDAINEILASKFIQNDIYNYLQLSIYKKLKEHLNIEDESFNNNFKNNDWNVKSTNILKMTIELLAIICERTPSKIENLDFLVDRIEIILDVLKHQTLTDLFYNTVYLIKNNYLELQKQIRHKNEKRLFGKNFKVEPPENFREVPIIPNINEIVSSNGLFLRSNLKFGPFDSVEHYLDVHFRLLREDYVGSLREGVMEYLATKDIEKQKTNKKQLSANIMNIRVYKNVKILSDVFEENNILHLIKFEMTNKLKSTRWETSKRLIQGSLVCLTNDNFKTVYFAVIYDRDVKKLKDGKILIKFDDWISVNNRFLRYDSFSNGNFIMIETLAYFESYRYTLEALKTFNENNFPFAEYIIYSRNDEIHPPKYLTNETENLYYDFKPIIKDSTHQNGYSNIDILQIQMWPNSILLGLNKSQYSALHLALTKELVVIQGPPGTGI